MPLTRIRQLEENVSRNPSMVVEDVPVYVVQQESNLRGHLKPNKRDAIVQSIERASEAYEGAARRLGIVGLADVETPAFVRVRSKVVLNLDDVVLAGK